MLWHVIQQQLEGGSESAALGGGVPYAGACSTSGGAAAAATPGARACWTEAHVAVVQAHLDTRSELPDPALEQLLRACRAASQQQAMAASAKFCQLLMALLTQHGRRLSGRQVALLQAAAGGTRTFLTKGLVAKLEKLAGS